MKTKFDIGELVAFKDKNDYTTPEHQKQWYVGRVVRISIAEAEVLTSVGIMYHVNCMPEMPQYVLPESRLKPVSVHIDPLQEAKS